GIGGELLLLFGVKAGVADIHANKRPGKPGLVVDQPQAQRRFAGAELDAPISQDRRRLRQDISVAVTENATANAVLGVLRRPQESPFHAKAFHAFGGLVDLADRKNVAFFDHGLWHSSE